MSTDVDGGPVGTVRPEVRPEVALGPALVQGSGVVHFMHDPVTDMYYRIGAREAFVVGRLLAGDAIEDAQGAYAEHYGAPLPDATAAAFVVRLAQRGLLVGAPGEVLDAIARRGAAERHRRTAVRALFPVPWLGRLVRSASRRLRWALAPGPLVVLSLLGLAAGVWTAAHVDELVAVPHGWGVNVLTALVLAASVGVHELFHGVACTRFGGVPREVGLMWRAPIVAAYCSVDDVVVFPRTRDRVVTVYAGTYAHLVVLVVLWLAYALSPAGGTVHAVAASSLLAGSAIVVVNLVPVFGLDGYRMLEHATGTWSLQGSAFAHVGARLARRPSPRLPARLARLYWCYATLSTALVAAGVVTLVGVWWRTLDGYWGPSAATAFLAAEAVLLVLAGVWLRRRAARSAARKAARS